MQESPLQNLGWIRVLDQIPPRGERILLGEVDYNGTLNSFYTEVSKPFKGKENGEFLYYKMNEKYEILRSDMYWKDE
jgi:hypothetical protein